MLRVITTNIDFKDTIEGNVSLTPVSQQVITATGLISGPKGERGEKGEKGDPGIAWVTSVQGFNGDIVLTKEHIGLSDVDNTSDLAKPISTATQTALNNKANSTHTHTASSVTDLDNAVSNNSTVQANTSARHTHDNKDTLDATTASYTTVKDTKLSGIATGATANATDAQLRDRTTHTGAQAISTVTGLQTALDGKQATITAGTTSQYYRGDKSWQTLDKASVGLANVDNTSDANKIISTATQAALDTKATTTALTAHTNNTSNPHSVTKAQVGLGNVSNLAPADMPVSTAQQSALNAKANASDTVNLTGNQTVAGVKTFSSSPIVPTATTNTQAVNKAQMDAADDLKVNKAGDTMTGALTVDGGMSPIIIRGTGASNFLNVAMANDNANTGAQNVNERRLVKNSSGTLRPALEQFTYLTTPTAGSERSTVRYFTFSNGAQTKVMEFDGPDVSVENQLSVGGARYISGTGFPEGVVSAPVGSIYIDKNITNGIAIWYKKTGTASTGWIPLSLSSTPPATATSTGISGQTAYDSNYYYICVATNTWKRTPLSSW